MTSPDAGTGDVVIDGLIKLVRRVASEQKIYRTETIAGLNAAADTIARLVQQRDAASVYIKVLEQAVLETHHAQVDGANWYTRGASGLYDQVARWIRKSHEASGVYRAAIASKGQEGK
jgi:transcriptional regulator GlxA family with amidase domain